MFELFNSYWSLLGLPITAIVGWFLGGRQAKKQEIKKGDVDIKIVEIDYAKKVSEIYEVILAEQKADKETLKSERDEMAKESKEEREYFRTQLDDVRKQCNTIQDNLNTVQLNWAREIEVSQNWEKLHREVTAQYNDLNLKYTALESKYSVMDNEHGNLKKEHDKLKVDFDKYKKEHKSDKV